MDWLPLALGAAGMGLQGGQWYMNNKAMRSQNAMQKAGLSFQRDSARRNLDQLLEDIPRGRRMLEGSLADRGISDSSIANQNLGYYDRRGQRQLKEGKGGLIMAHKQLSNFKKMVKRQRLANYLNLGTSLLGAGGNALMSMNQTPSYNPRLDQALYGGNPYFDIQSPWGQ